MHCHTKYSSDGFITGKQLDEMCEIKKIDCVCLTDHNSLTGAIEYSKNCSVKIVVGEEIKTIQGEVIGLFIREHIPPGLSLKETIRRIKEQYGIVYLPHPFDEVRHSAIKENDVVAVKDQIDVIEIFNSRTLNPKYNKMALEFAVGNNIPAVVGSDAHYKYELGLSYMTMERFDDAQGFLMSVKNAKYVTRRCPFLLRAYIKGLKILTGKK
jgi:hypothetical protein